MKILKVKFPELLMLVHLWPVHFLYLNQYQQYCSTVLCLSLKFAFFTYEPLKTIISGHFFTIPDRNSLRRFALTHFSIVNFAIESKFVVNWTMGTIKDVRTFVLIHENLLTERCTRGTGATLMLCRGNIWHENLKLTTWP